MIELFDNADSQHQSATDMQLPCVTKQGSAELTVERLDRLPRDLDLLGNT